MRQKGISRRRVFAAAPGAMVFGGGTSATPPPEPESAPKDGPAALDRLKAGNARFAAGKSRHSHEAANWRRRLVEGQQPFATILGCSDSRVPTELVFDQGFGDLFVVRVAGNVISDDVVGSIAYAGFHLRTPLFVVMGHAGCGAVSAAVDAKLKRVKEPEQIESLIRLIQPGLKDLDWSLGRNALLDVAVAANVRWSLRQLTGLPPARAAVERHRCVFVGAVYDLDAGRVRFFQ